MNNVRLLTAVALAISSTLAGAQQAASCEEYGHPCPTRTHYEFFASPVNLTTEGIALVPNAFGGWEARREPYSFRQPGPTVRNLALDDDAGVRNLAVPHATYLGSITTSSIDVASNGYIWIGTGGGSLTDFSPTVPEFVTQDARVAAFWSDLDPQGLTGTDGVLYEHVAVINTTFITWNRVPHFGGTTRHTFQVQFHGTGTIVCVYSTASNPANAVLVGVTLGTTYDNGDFDWSSKILPGHGDIGRPGHPMLFSCATPPIVGSTWNLTLANVPAGPLSAVINLGVAQQAVSLDFLGMHKCYWNTTIELSFPFVPASPTTAISTPIPGVAALVGSSAYLQAVVMAPGVNVLGVAMSNGIRATFGDF
jgi:hypothetical protein